MSEIAELRELQNEYIEERNRCYDLIRKQNRDLSKCAPSAYTIQACEEREDRLRADADGWQKRIDAIQKKLDEAIGLDAPGNEEFEGQDLATIQRRVKYIRRQGGYYSRTVHALRRRPAGDSEPVDQEGGNQ